MRAILRTALIEALPTAKNPQDLPAERWYGSGAVVDTPPRPFAEIRFGGRFPGVAAVRRRRLEVWIHDDEGSYDRIEEWIQFVKGVLDGAAHLTDGSGNEVILCSWVNDSTDLYDGGYRTNCLMSAFDVVGKEV